MHYINICPELGLKAKYNEENGIIKKIVCMMSGIIIIIRGCVTRLKASVTHIFAVKSIK